MSASEQEEPREPELAGTGEATEEQIVPDAAESIRSSLPRPAITDGRPVKMRRPPGVGQPSVLRVDRTECLSGGDLGALFGALAKARSAAKPVEKDAENQHHRFLYASADAIADAGRLAMDGTGLSLVPVSHELLAPPAPAPKVVFVMRSRYCLTHEDGGWFMLDAVDWPVIDNKGKDIDRSFASARTSSRAYITLDLLNMSRREPDEDVGHDPPAGAPDPVPAPSGPPGLTDKSMEGLHKKIRECKTPEAVELVGKWIRDGSAGKAMTPEQARATQDLLDLRLGQVMATVAVPGAGPVQGIDPPPAAVKLKKINVEDAKKKIAASDAPTLRKLVEKWKAERTQWAEPGRSEVDRAFQAAIAKFREEAQRLSAPPSHEDAVRAAEETMKADPPRASVMQAIQSLKNPDIVYETYQALVTWWGQQYAKATQNEQSLMDLALRQAEKVIDDREAAARAAAPAGSEG